MNVLDEIRFYIESIPEPKQQELRFLHELIIQHNPKCKLWYFTGKDENNKTVSNPNIGYGELTLNYANGKSANWFQVGLSANKSGISIYLLGIKDKSYLKDKFSQTIGKASITGYCIKFKTIKDIQLDVFKQVLDYGFSER